MNRLCPTTILCPGPQPGIDGDSPITNYSSEYTDGPDFFAPIFPYWNPFDPGLPAWWQENACLGIPCFSTISQQDAELCALRLGIICSNLGPPPPLPQLPTLCQTILTLMQQYQNAGDTANFDIYQNLYLTQCLGEQPPTTPYEAFSCGQLSSLIQTLSGSDDPTDKSNAALAQAVYNTKCTGPPTNRRALYYNNPATFTAVCQDGFGGGTVTVAAGTFATRSQILADRLANAYARLVAEQNLVCPSQINSSACANQPYSDTITVTGGSPPFTISLASGEMPPGIGIVQTDNHSALVSGTPTTPGNYTFAVGVTSAAGTMVVRSYTINVLGITNIGALPQGTVGQSYAFSLVAAGGVPPYTFTISAGTLPTGLTMDPFGNITGTPTTAQSTAFVVAVTDFSP